VILYFSGTGNSRYAAEIIAEVCDDEVVSINDLLKQREQRNQREERGQRDQAGQGEEVTQGEQTKPGGEAEQRDQTRQAKQEWQNKLASPSKPYVIVSPIYSWRIPRVVSDFIRETDFTGRKECYLVVTCGSSTANAIGYFKGLCAEKGFVLKGFAELVMPDNYLLMSSVKLETAKQIVENVTPRIREIAAFIKDEAALPEFTPKWKILSGIINDLFYKIFVKANGFHINDKCNGCGKCVQLCPLNNIGMQKTEAQNVDVQSVSPRWNNNCTHCMACICGCPSEAIEYKNKTKGKVRYSLGKVSNS
jgi:ferredoxin